MRGFTFGLVFLCLALFGSVATAGPCSGGSCGVPRLRAVVAAPVRVVGKVVARRPVRRAVGRIVSRRPVRRVLGRLICR